MIKKISGFILIALFFVLPAFAWETTISRPLDAGPFQVSVVTLSGGNIQYTVNPDGNYGDECLSIIVTPQVWSDGFSAVETHAGGNADLKITISIPIPLIDKFYCCEFNETKVSLKLATCAGSKDCCGAACNQCCTRYTVDHCWISDNSDCS